MGEQFWVLVQSICKIIVDNRNASGAILLNKVITLKEEKEIQENAKRSDMYMVIPLLFNFYHGVELMLKGFVLFAEGPQEKLEHNLIQLQERFAKRYANQYTLIAYFAKYLDKSQMPGLLRTFLNGNNLTVNRFYESFRYPANKDLSQEFKYFTLKYKGLNGVDFYETLANDISEMMRLIVALGNSLKQ
jgi:hypothetical protein